MSDYSLEYFLIPLSEIFKTGDSEFVQECKLYYPCRAVPLFPYYYLRNPVPFIRLFIGIGPVYESNNIGILLQGTAFAKIRELRAFVGTGFRLTAELRDGYNRDF